MTADNHTEREDFTIMSHESHGQCFCAEGVHCGNGTGCTGLEGHPDLDITAIREREVSALRRVWKAMGCASNPDDFKPEVRDRMWDQVVESCERDAAKNNSLYRENATLRAEVERLQGELDAQTVEWGVQMIADGRVIDAKTVAADELVNHMPEAWRHVSRKVGPWLPVPTDGAEN